MGCILHRDMKIRMAALLRSLQGYMQLKANNEGKPMEKAKDETII